MVFPHLRQYVLIISMVHLIYLCKGRDWYDFEWYVQNNIPLNFKHLQERIHEFTGEWISKEEFDSQLHNKLANTDIAVVKADVLPFLYERSARDLDFWSNEYFLALAERIRWV